MHIKRMREMIEQLSECALCELEGGREEVCTEEFGAVVDMIKDLSEAEYKARISKAMEEAELEDEAEERHALKWLMEEYGEDDGRRYYDNYRLSNGRFAGKGASGARYMPRRGYAEPEYYMMPPEGYHTPEHWRDMDRDKGRMYYTESGARGMHEAGSGKSPIRRAEYIRAKSMHAGESADDKAARVKKLEEYMDELNEDLKELMGDMMPEEKSVVKQKITKLGTLI